MVLDQLSLLYSQYSDIILSVIYIVGSVLVAESINFALKRYATKLTKKTKTHLDDILLKAVTKLISLGFLLSGIFFALRTIRYAGPYQATISMGFTVIFGLYGAFFAIRIINSFVEWYGTEIAAKTKSKKDNQFVPVIKKVIYLVIGAIALLWILGQVGVQITTLVATLGIGGLAVALALQPTLSNFFSGAYIMTDRPIKIGDYIELSSGETGYVHDVGWRSTKIRTWDGNLIIIPNITISSTIITNYQNPTEEMLIKVPCGVSYNEDLSKVEKVCIDVAKKTMKRTKIGLHGFNPVVRFNQFGDSNINFNVLMKIAHRPDKFLLIHEYIKDLKKEFDKQGIEIAWPMRKLHFDEDQFKSLTGKK